MEASERLRRDLSVELRAQGRADRLGLEATCACCGDTTLVHLNRLREHEVCGCCLALSQGKRLILEGHHLAGRSEGPVVDVCRNCHLELTELQRSWVVSRANKNPHWWPDNSPRLKGPGARMARPAGAARRAAQAGRGASTQGGPLTRLGPIRAGEAINGSL